MHNQANLRAFKQVKNIQVQLTIKQSSFPIHKFIMRYNQLTYHKASPFYKQDFLPDRAWYNRKPKEFPSEIPTGQQYFTDSGRRHYQHRFNHSEIQQNGVLTSPEKYPYQNRIALDKSYMRSLDTTDIEGAGSGTRVNEAIRYKLRAQEELARKHNQSLNMHEHKQHQYEQKRRELALKQFDTIQQKKNKTSLLENNQNNNANPEKDKIVEQSRNQQYQRNPNPDSMNGQKYITLLPKPYYAHLQNKPRQIYNNRTIEPPSPQLSEPLANPRKQSQQRSQKLDLSNSRTQQHPAYIFNANDRHKSNPVYVNNYEQQLQKRRQDYLHTIELDQKAKEKYIDKKQMRKNNPTHLSFNLAGQEIIGNKH